MKIRNVVAVLGTQREAIRLAPLVLAMRQQPDLRPIVVVTGEESPALQRVLTLFDITADFRVTIEPAVERPTGSGKPALSGLDQLLSEEPDLVMVQGHTDSTFAAMLAAFFHRVPVVHVGEGLNGTAEQAGAMNQLLATRLCALHLASTARAAESLRDNNVSPDSIVCTGDPAVDALLTTVATPARRRLRLIDELEQHEGPVLLVDQRSDCEPERLHALGRAIVRLAAEQPTLRIVFPTQDTSATRELLFPVLSQTPQILITEPFDYELSCRVIARSDVILTDCGEVEEAGCSLGKPVLGLRDAGENPSVPAGPVRLIGMDEAVLVDSVRTILRCPLEYQAMIAVANPYGDGRAAQRTVEAIRHFFGVGARPHGFDSGAVRAESAADLLPDEPLKPHYV